MVAFGTVLSVLLVVTAISGVFSLVASGQGSAAGTTLRNQPGAVPWDGRSPLTTLLIGLNGGRRPAAGSLMVAQYRPADDSLSVLAIPTALWVSIPGYGKGRIAQAYADGGARLMLIAVQSALRLPIPFYATIDPSTARQLVDAIGPLRVSGMAPDGATTVQTLDGARALRYTAVRPVEDGANLLRRQLRILLATRAAAFTPATLPGLPSLLGRLAGGLSTNIPFSVLPNLARHLGHVSPGRIRAAALDLANGSLMNFNNQGATMLLADPAGTPALARRLLEMPMVHAPGGVAILNGTGVPGLASALGDWLRQAGIPVRTVASAAGVGYTRTRVVISVRASPADERAARAIATLLQVPVIREAPLRPGAAVRVLIGTDYQDPTQP